MSELTKRAAEKIRVNRVLTNLDPIGQWHKFDPRVSLRAPREVPQGVPVELHFHGRNVPHVPHWSLVHMWKTHPETRVLSAKLQTFLGGMFPRTYDTAWLKNILTRIWFENVIFMFIWIRWYDESEWACGYGEYNVLNGNVLCVGQWMMNDVYAAPRNVVRYPGGSLPEDRPLLTVHGSGGSVFTSFQDQMWPPQPFHVGRTTHVLVSWLWTIPFQAHAWAWNYMFFTPTKFSIGNWESGHGYHSAEGPARYTHEAAEYYCHGELHNPAGPAIAPYTEKLQLDKFYMYGKRIRDDVYHRCRREGEAFAPAPPPKRLRGNQYQWDSE